MGNNAEHPIPHFSRSDLTGLIKCVLERSICKIIELRPLRYMGNSMTNIIMAAYGKLNGNVFRHNFLMSYSLLGITLYLHLLIG